MKPARKQTSRERAALSPIKNIQWEGRAVVKAPPAAPRATKPPKPIRRSSKARGRQLYHYHKRVKVWKELNPFCDAMIDGICTTHTQDCHHQAGRIGDSLHDETQWLPVCRACHDFITNNKGWARRNGFSK